MQKQPAPEKDVIFYARDYRHFTTKASNTVLFCLLYVLPVTLVFVLFYAPITNAVCRWAGNILAQITGQEITIHGTPFLPHLGQVSFLSVPDCQPSFMHALICGLISLMLLPIVSQIQRNFRSLMIYFCMALYVQLISCAFFLFFPDRFPYTITDYSELYMIQMAALLIILPAIFGVAVSLMRASIVLRVGVALCQIAVQLLYNIIRYVVYLSLLYYCSSLYMATLYFTLGVLFDFIQMVCVYSFFAKRVSELYDSPEGRAKWAWS